MPHANTTLNTGWTLSFTNPLTHRPQQLPATVPGNVEIDLMKAGLIKDPYPADTPNAMHAWELVDDWLYQTVFDAPPAGAGEMVHLVFEGIDTIADVTLNGVALMRCENMLIPHSADVTGRLKPTGNTVAVRIHSPELHARRFKYPAGAVSRGYRQPEAYLRKARHMWGWDNAPRLLSAGLWRPVRLEISPAIRFDEVYVYTQQVTDDSVWIGCDWSFITPDADLAGYHCVLRLSFNGKVEQEIPFEVMFTAGRMRHRFPADAVRLWWPRGYGQPSLYDLSLHLYKGTQQVAEWSSRFGIRQIDLIRSETTNRAGDGEFIFECNNKKIYINGTNWKPLDAMHSLAAGKIRKALDLCVDLNCNMVRIWGGGVYEDHDFFDYCDEHGLLVWQDFMFACEFPPRDEFYQKAVAHEAEVIVKRLRNHASLAIWCGDNEIDAMFGWGTTIPRNLLPSDNVISREVLREAVINHDPYRNYVPSSPYMSDEIAKQRWRRKTEDPAALATPEQHLYPGNEHFRDVFRTCAAHFIGETGPFFINAMSQSPDIIAREMGRSRRMWNQPMDGVAYTLDRHQTDPHFLTWKDATRKRLHHLFGRDFGLENCAELATAANILSGEIFKFAIEYSRSRKWRKTGVLWWSLLDMWPMMFNYSVVDYEFRPKQPAYDWIRQSQQPQCLMVVEDDKRTALELFAANETLAPWDGVYRIVAIDAAGRETDHSSGTFHLEANQTVTIQRHPHPTEPSLWMLQWQSGGQSACNHFIAGQPPYDFDVYRTWCDRSSARSAKT